MVSPARLAQNETICAAYSLAMGDAPSKYPVELLVLSRTVTKRRSGGRYLLVIMRAGGIGVGKVDRGEAGHSGHETGVGIGQA